MRNPFRTLAGWVRSPEEQVVADGLATSVSADSALEDDPPTELPSRPGPPMPGSLEELVLQVVREEFTFFSRRFENDGRRTQKGLAHEIGEIASTVRQTRAEVERRFAALEQTHSELVDSTDAASGRLGSVDFRVNALADVVEQQLRSTERSLVSLRESSERQVRALEQSRDRLTKEIEDVAGFLERAGEPRSDGADRNGASRCSKSQGSSWLSWADPRSWLLRAPDTTRRLAQLEQRTRVLERQVVEQSVESQKKASELRLLLDRALDDGAHADRELGQCDGPDEQRLQASQEPRKSSSLTDVDAAVER